MSQRLSRLQSFFISVSVTPDCNANLKLPASDNSLDDYLQTVSFPSDVAQFLWIRVLHKIWILSWHLEELLNLAMTADQRRSTIVQAIPEKGKGKGYLASQDDVVDNFH